MRLRRGLSNVVTGVDRVKIQDNSGSGLSFSFSDSYITSSSLADVSNLLVTGNLDGVSLSAEQGGSLPINIRNATIAFNTNNEAECPFGSEYINFESCILWDSNTSITQGCYKFTYTTIADNSISGTGNIYVNPQFTNTTTKDYTLKTTSPCKNKGKPGTTGLPTKDLAGNPRVVGGTVDMGAYEIQ